MVWKTSTKLGIGFARGSYTFGKKKFDNCIFVVGRYKEHGNMGGAYQQNVAKGSFNKANVCEQKDILTIARKRDMLQFVI